MECGQVRRGREILSLEQRGNTRAHLTRGLVRKGDGENGRSRNVTLADKVRNAMRNHASFSAAGACQDQQRTFGVSHRFALLGI